MGGGEDDGWAQPAGVGGRRSREEGGKEEECDGGTGGSGMNRTVGYVTAVFGF